VLSYRFMESPDCPDRTNEPRTDPLLTIVYGTRPEAIKLAPLATALRRTPGVQVQVVYLGQHPPSLMVVPAPLQMLPDRVFQIADGRRPLSGVIAEAWRLTAEVVEATRTDAVVVQGDTATAFGAALGAFYTCTAVIHLEAGLRTHDLRSPFPEEANRKLISGITSLHLAPTRTARNNLVRERVAERDIHVVGNTSIDALRLALSAWRRSNSTLPPDLLDRPGEVLTFTAHRRENWPRMEEFARLVVRLATAHPATAVALPLHPNRTVSDVMRAQTAGLANVYFLGPLPYDDMMALLCRTRVLVTDSGGLQEEAAFLGVPTLVIRDTTERPEGIAAGVARLAGTNCAVVESAAEELLRSDATHRGMAKPSDCYGDGTAAARAATAITGFLRTRGAQLAGPTGTCSR
jgi:UDP-N-acetylglucosamine 2-epimerase (non-hydrolysing)